LELVEGQCRELESWPGLADEMGKYVKVGDLTLLELQKRATRLKFLIRAERDPVALAAALADFEENANPALTVCYGGWAYLIGGEQHQAEDAFELAAGLAEKEGSKVELVRGLVCAADGLAELGERSKARRLLKLAGKPFETVPEDKPTLSEAVTALSSLAEGHYTINEDSKGDALLWAARTLMDQLRGEEVGGGSIVDPGLQLVTAMTKSGDITGALEMAEELSQGLEWFLSVSLINITGYLAFERKCDEVLELAGGVKDQDTRNDIITRAAFCYAEAGEKRNARRLLKEVTEWAEALPEKEQKAMALASVAQAAGMAGQRKLALRMLKDAVRIVESVSQELDTPYVYVKLAVGFARAADFSRALNIVKELGLTENRFYAVTALQGIGSALLDQDTSLDHESRAILRELAGQAE